MTSAIPGKKPISNAPASTTECIRPAMKNDVKTPTITLMQMVNHLLLKP